MLTSIWPSWYIAPFHFWGFFLWNRVVYHAFASFRLICDVRLLNIGIIVIGAFWVGTWEFYSVWVSKVSDKWWIIYFWTSRSYCLVRGSKWYDDYSSNLCANLWFSPHNVENYDYMTDKPPNESSKYSWQRCDILPSMNS